MKKVALLAIFGAIALVGPAQASKPVDPGKPAEPPQSKPAKPAKPPQSCVAHQAGYNSRGTLVAAALVPESDGTYSGTLEVDVTKANHKAPTGDQTFTLDHAKVKFHHGTDPAAPPPGSRVKLHGKIAHLPKHCTTDGSAPATTIEKVDIDQAKH